MGAKRAFFVLIACFALVAMLALVGAAKGGINDNASDKDQMRFGAIPANESAKEAKNMTYGQCVSEGAKAKNDCYSSVKDAYSSCKSASGGLAKNRACRTTYTKDTNQCKKDFKSTKDECKKIKHNFLETIRYGLA